MTIKVDEALLTRYYNLCNPAEPLPPNDPRNVKVDDLHDGARVRGDDWVGRIAREISRSGQPSSRFFSGLTGSGKSTELLRLVTHLEGKEFFPVLINAEDYIDLSARIDIPDILALLLYHTERAVLKLEKKDPEKTMTNGALGRLWEWISRTDLQLTRAEMDLKSDWLSGKIVTELKTNPTVRQKVRTIVSAHLSKFLEEVRTEFRSLDARVKAAGCESGLVVILDSLEKLQGTSTNWTEVLASAEHIFAGGAPMLQLPVHTLYTFPPALTRRLAAEDIYFLPMIKVRDRARSPYGPGIEVARQLLRKRIPEEALRALFGDAEYEARERELITRSGGYPRELIRLLRDIVAEDEKSYPLSESAFRTILRRAGDQYAGIARATQMDLTVTARIALHQTLSLKDQSELATADHLMSRNIIFRYLNEAEWFDVHPAVLRLPEVVQTMKQIERERLPPLPALLSLA
ncbi:MAG: hypothetical protein MUF64_02530 [Polyangiaceae bacterium]|jgi:hypothetical protein|nr:hypothetical protein [Polyangiaceae bacterium]